MGARILTPSFLLFGNWLIKDTHVAKWGSHYQFYSGLSVAGRIENVAGLPASRQPSLSYKGNIHLVASPEAEKSSASLLGSRSHHTADPQRLEIQNLLLWLSVQFSHSIMSDSGNSWTAAHQAPLSIGFPRQEYSSGLPFPPPGDLPDPTIKPKSPALQVDSLPLHHLGSPQLLWSKC